MVYVVKNYDLPTSSLHLYAGFRNYCDPQKFMCESEKCGDSDSTADASGSHLHIVADVSV